MGNEDLTFHQGSELLSVDSTVLVRIILSKLLKDLIVELVARRELWFTPTDPHLIRAHLIYSNILYTFSLYEYMNIEAQVSYYSHHVVVKYPITFS